MSAVLQSRPDEWPCAVCAATIARVPGRKPRRYCSEDCRAAANAGERRVRLTYQRMTMPNMKAIEAWARDRAERRAEVLRAKAALRKATQEMDEMEKAADVAQRLGIARRAVYHYMPAE